MRITLFSPDIPYPATRGGRADVWRRILALRQAGVAIHLVHFYDDEPGKRPSAGHLEVVKDAVDRHTMFAISKGLLTTAQRLPHIAHTPWHVVCRSLTAALQAELLADIKLFKPDWLLAEGPWCGREVLAASSMLGVPFAYRSHNIEHQYMARQAASARRPRDRLAWRIACVGLERFERLMLRKARWVFDISCDDMAFWQAQGIQHISWLAPIAESAQGLSSDTALQTDNTKHDVLFLGNLTTPNNVRGVEWLLNEIRPLVLAQRPATQFVVAGSNPGDHVRNLCAAPNVTLLPNVADALALYRQARVLVNPVRTGSGTHIKAIEMLMMRAPIVTATQGTQGMPPDVKRMFRVADTSETFAEQVLEALAQDQDCWAERAPARRLFGQQGLADALQRLAALLDRPHAGAAPGA
jgi:polysaccharide biosynthesis protein PslH